MEYDYKGLKVITENMIWFDRKIDLNKVVHDLLSKSDKCEVLRFLIDYALDSRQKEEFMKYTDEYNELFI